MAASRPPRIGGNELFSTSLERALSQATFAMSVDIRNGVAQATQSALKGASPTFKAVNQAITRSLQSRTEFRAAHEIIADKARAAVLESYDEKVSGEAVPSYRVGQNRYSGGKLRRALGRQGMFVGTYEGIAFLNENILNQEARHWGRLNYGASPRAKLAPFSHRLSIAGRSIGSAALTPPSNYDFGSFKMPKGKWKNGNQFYPTGKALVTPTKGIAGRRFLDAGVSAIADSLDETYQDLLFTIMKQAKEKGRGTGTKITVNPGRLGFKI